MDDRVRLRALVVAGAVDAAIELDVVHVPTIDGARAVLSEGQTFDVVLLGAAAAPEGVLDAIGSLRTDAPTVPVVVLPRRSTEHLRAAIEVASNPRTAADYARRVWKLLPSYLASRARDAAILEEALRRSDFDAIARIGHTLRGNGAAFAFPEVSDVGEAIEAAARAQSREGVRDGIARLRACVG
jgi:HPt (histidine-containing phosphotransfer) domain-containing protein